MKRTISIILTVLLVATTAVLLVACDGGIKSEDWYNAMEEYKTADALTLTITDEVWTYKSIVFDEHIKHKSTITFDAENGVVSIIRENSGNNLSGFYLTTEDRYYYVLDGTNVIEYHRYVTEFSDNWDSPRTHKYDTVELAIEYLRDLYLNPCDTDKIEFPSFLELSYYGETMTSTGNPRETKVNMFKNKFTQKYIDDQNNITRTYELTFSKGKLSKYYFEYNTGALSNKRKTTINIKYSSNLNLPDDLPDEDFHL